MSREIMKDKDFLSIAGKIFGDKIRVGQMRISDEDAEKLKLKAEDVKAYPAQAWIPERNGAYRCPHCDASLGGLGGSFAWGIVHGIGYCSKCKEVEFRYYHYVAEKGKVGNRRFALWAVCGISKKLIES